MVFDFELLDRGIRRILEHGIDGDESGRGGGGEIETGIGEKEDGGDGGRIEDCFCGGEVGKNVRGGDLSTGVIGEIEDAVRGLVEEGVDALLEKFGVAILGGAGAGGEIDHHDDFAGVGLEVGKLAGGEGEEEETEEDEELRGAGHVGAAEEGDDENEESEGSADDQGWDGEKDEGEACEH